MNWTLMWDLVFFAGAICSLALLVYGGWLCIPAPEEEPAKASFGGKRGAAMRGPRRVAPTGFHLGVFALFCAFVTLVPARDARAADPFERGIKAYQDSKYPDALAQFRIAANAGNSHAQEILGFMYLHGPNTYGAAVSQDRAEAIYWFGQAAKGGREVAQHMLCTLSGRPASTVLNRSSCVASAGSISSGRP